MTTQTEITLTSVLAPQHKSIERVFQLQREYRWTAKASFSADRIAKLERLRRAFLAHAGEVNAALAADLARPPEEPASIEVAIVLSDLNYTIANLGRWMAPTTVEPAPLIPLPGLPGTQMYIHYEAKGIVLVFGAWNQPFMLLLQPIIAAIAAGNTVIAKPNELTPASSQLVAAIIREAFDERDVAVFEGGIDLANRLLELPVDHIFFTGSPAVGRTVAAAAAKHLAGVTLELGGKSPAIIDGTTNMKETASIIAGAKLYNAGQVCISFDHVWIKKEARDEFVARYKQWLEDTIYVGGNLRTGALTHMVNRRNFDRVAGYVDDAVQNGATLIGTGRRDVDTLTIEPALLLDMSLSSRVMQDEIFGPILPVLTYDSLDEITAHLRSTEKPLAIYAFTTDQGLVDRLLQETSSGGLAVNGWASHAFDSTLPFGGAGNSGSGYYRGEFGFRELSHARGVAHLAKPFDSVAAVQG
jgi:aldehyde dehydrogenase (NAD+)